MKIDSILKSPIVSIIGLLFLVSACQAEKTAEQITLLFWSSIAANDIDLAKTYCKSGALQLLSTLQAPDFKDTSFNYGKIVIDGKHATVETKISPPLNNKSLFTTYLVKEENSWKVECERSVNDLTSNQGFREFIKNLNIIGEDLNKKLEQQLPIIEKEIESFGQELKRKIDELADGLIKSQPSKQHNPYQGSI